MRTSLGLSTQSFSNNDDWVLGTLQGSGATPCPWTAITCVLLDALEKETPGITFFNPQGTSVHNSFGEAYVDNTELWLTIPEMSIVQLTYKMQEMVQHWDQLLYTTGGALALEKCFFVSLEWQFINDEHTLSTSTAMSTSISLSSGNNFTKHVSILQSSTSEGKCNLGAWLAPDGNNKADLEMLCSKGRSMSIHITVSQLN